MIRLVCVAALLLGAAAVANVLTSVPAPVFTLNSSCPPGFEKTGSGVCELRTLYQFYDSLEGRGLGGTRTALPPYRDGFTPHEIDLGRYLFFDPVLSGDHSLACASCHDPARGLSD